MHRGKVPRTLREYRTHPSWKHCTTVEYTTSKTGKHGHAKAHIVAVDIFTDKKMEELCPTSHNMGTRCVAQCALHTCVMEAPVVKKVVYSVIDANDHDGTCSLQDDDGEMHDGFDLPPAG